MPGVTDPKFWGKAIRRHVSLDSDRERPYGALTLGHVGLNSLLSTESNDWPLASAGFLVNDEGLVGESEILGLRDRSLGDRPGVASGHTSDGEQGVRRHGSREGAIVGGAVVVTVGSASSL